MEGIVYVASVRVRRRPPSSLRTAISRQLFVLGSYDSETHTTNAKTARNMTVLALYVGAASAQEAPQGTLDANTWMHHREVV
jgi:hypothetical protein